MLYRSFLCSMLCLLLGSAATAQVSSATLNAPVADREFRGVWVATVANIDWPSTRSLSSEKQKEELIRILDKCRELKLNAVVLQVRPACDALYKSDLEPWSDYLTGQLGKAPEPFYDPLEFAVEEAHKRGLELHTWINPYRAKHPATTCELPKNHVAVANPDIVRKVGKYLWLDPSEPKTQEHVYKVVLDIVKRYDIDGMHMDDYFYPYRAYMDKNSSGTLMDFPDDVNWNAFVKSGGKLSKSDWRRSHVDKIVEKLYTGIKAEKKWVKFGISPFGLWRPGYPKGVSGLDQHEELYANARKWLNEGWLDYYSPQLYWAISNPNCSYSKMAQWWISENTHKRHMWFGNALYKIAEENARDRWPVNEIVNQVAATRSLPGASGNIFFSMKMFANNSVGINKEIEAKVYNRPALVPASTWLDGEAPEKPSVTIQSAGAENSAATWNAADAKDVFNWVVYTKYNDGWTYRIFPTAVTTCSLESEGKGMPECVAVTAVDRCGNESERALLFCGRSSDSQQEAPPN